MTDTKVAAMQLIMAHQGSGTAVPVGQRPEKVSLTANIDGSTLQRRRSMKTDTLRPILKQRLASLQNRSNQL